MTNINATPAMRRRTALRLALLVVGLLVVQGARADDNDTWALLKKPGHIAAPCAFSGVAARRR